jgi:hypothetical protein
MDYLEELKTLTLLTEIAEVRLSQAMRARWEDTIQLKKRNIHRIDVAMMWADRRKRQMIELLNKNTYMSQW